MSASENVPAQTGVGPKLKVFVSYSRKDAAFADQLVSGLELAVLMPISISTTSRQESHGRTASAASFAMRTRSSLSSRQAQLRPNIANGRWRKPWGFPSGFCPSSGSASRQSVPEQLRRLNYIFFTDDQSFIKNLGQLANALKQCRMDSPTHALRRIGSKLGGKGKVPKPTSPWWGDRRRQDLAGRAAQGRAADHRATADLHRRQHSRMGSGAKEKVARQGISGRAGLCHSCGLHRLAEPGLPAGMLALV